MSTTETHTLRSLLIRASPQRQPTLTLPQTPEPTTATTQEEARTTRPRFPTSMVAAIRQRNLLQAEIGLREIGAVAVRRVRYLT